MQWNRRGNTDVEPSVRRWLILLCAIVLVAGGITIWVVLHQAQETTQAKDQTEAVQSDKEQVATSASDLAASVTRLCRAGGKDAEPLRAAGLCTKANATKEVVEEATDSTPTTEPRPPSYRYVALSDAELDAQLGVVARDYFRSYCAGNRCKGDDAPPVSQTQVGSQVADQLPGLLSAQLPAALSANCGGSCKSDTPGPAGTEGAKGDKGDPADPAPVAVASFTCTGGLSPITYTVMYTDGTTQEYTCGDLPPVEDPDSP